MKAKIIALAFSVSLLAACGPAGPVGNSSVPQPSKTVDLDSYLGKWYELARYENQFERGCEGVTADYSLRDDGSVKVLNTCHKGSLGGKESTSSGVANIVPGSRGAKLRVSFFRPFYGDYWVLDHAPDYSWSIVGEPSGRYLWILGRKPKPSARTLEMLIGKAQALGYDRSLIRVTKQ